MYSLLNSEGNKETFTISPTSSSVAGFENCMSILQDGLFNHALRFLGQERMLRYLNVYPRDVLPKSLFPIQTTLADQTPPIHRIPVEILGEIFTHYIYSMRHMGDPIPQLSADFGCDGNPFVLGQVCGLWRHVVVTMPTLWQSLCVNEPTKGCVHLVELWLRRAGECPLTVQLLEREPTSHHGLEAMHAIILSLVRHIRQWSHITFRVSKYHQHTLAMLPVGHAMSLQHAEVYTRTWDYLNGDSTWRALHSSPVLTRVEWGGVYRDIDQMPDHVPWARLTYISLTMILKAASVLHILQACKNVTTLEIRGLYSSTAPSHESSLAVPSLRTLDIRAFDDPSCFLQGLILPNLTSLSINHSFGGFATTPRHVSRSFCNFLKQSSCHLDSFEFRDININEDDLKECLTSPSLMSITNLNIRAILTDLTISSLTTVEGAQQLLPNLKIMDISECHTTPGTFPDMVASRSSLEVVRVRFCPKSNDYIWDHAALQAMQRPDLDIVFL